MTYNEQLEEWIKGNSVHLEQCVPDFSCCCKEIVTSVEDKKLFYEAHQIKNQDVIDMFLIRFLGGAMSKMTTKRIYISGEQDILDKAERN